LTNTTTDETQSKKRKEIINIESEDDDNTTNNKDLDNRDCVEEDTTDEHTTNKRDHKSHWFCFQTAQTPPAELSQKLQTLQKLKKTYDCKRMLHAKC
jgi:hypothetical protein